MAEITQVQMKNALKEIFAEWGLDKFIIEDPEGHVFVKRYEGGEYVISFELLHRNFVNSDVGALAKPFDEFFDAIEGSPKIKGLLKGKDDEITKLRLQNEELRHELKPYKHYYVLAERMAKASGKVR